MKTLFSFIFLLVVCHASAQYAPQVGLPGSDAINAHSSSFVDWADQCTIQRGLMNIADASLGYVALGDSSLALGPADGNVMSLGDSGVAVLTFPHPIFNGDGPDFAIFENGFRDPSDSAQAFLELAFVEVSSDGVNYYRFPANSLTQASVQAGNGDYLIASNLNNLAGKYIGSYGTPFDLEDLTGIPGLDINNVTHVRIVDVVGDISNHSSYDSAERIINDPYPTPFPSGGFDLDAVGVINAAGKTNVKELPEGVSVTVYPNPATDKFIVSVKGSFNVGFTAALTTVSGRVLQQFAFSEGNAELPVTQYPPGIYYLVLRDSNGNRWVEKVTKR